MSPTFREELITLDGARVAHHRAEGTAPPLLFLHGVSGNHRLWPVLFEHLPRHAKLAPSLPGRCGSEGAVLPDASAAARWVARYLDHLGVDSVIPVGHSFGGAVALELALHAPSRVRGMVLVSSGARLRVHPAILEVVRESVALGRRLLPGRAAWTGGCSDALRDRVENARLETPLETELDDWLACDRFDRMDALGRIGCSVRILVGDRDATTPPKYAEYLAKHLPNASLRVVEGVGHMLPFEKAETVAAEIEDFARAVSGVRHAGAVQEEA